MTWKSFRQQGFNITEKEVEKLIPSILQNYREAFKRIDKELKDTYAKFLTGISPENYYNEMLKFDRLKKLYKTISQQYIEASKKAGKETGVAGEVGASNSFYRSQFGTNWLASVPMTVIPNDLVLMSVYGSQQAWKRYTKQLEKTFGNAANMVPQIGTLSDLLKNNRVKELENIQRAITQGLITGQSYTKVSKSVKEIIGQFLKKDGKISITGAMAAALRIVRTENTRIMNQMNEANTNYARSKGIDIVRVWDASLDNRTRPVHAQLDGKEENKNGFFESSEGLVKGPGQFSSVGQNVNCRCTTWESVEGSRPLLRRGRNPVTGENEVFDYKDFNKWAEDNNLKYNKFGKLVTK